MNDDDDLDLPKRDALDDVSNTMGTSVPGFQAADVGDDHDDHHDDDHDHGDDAEHDLDHGSAQRRDETPAALMAAAAATWRARTVSDLEAARSLASREPSLEAQTSQLTLSERPAAPLRGEA